MNKATQNALSGLIVRAALVAYGVYIVFVEQALPGATPWARAGLAAVVFALVLALGEISRLTASVKTLTLLTASSLQNAQGREMLAAARDDRAAVDILIAALSADDRDTREKAHKNLVRITGKDLPLDAATWSEWWAQAREGFGGQRR